ncbi:YitT family protein [Alicyclobacillus tolerans]|uniref:YitT family protein n=1 Tax=Alicyclobacillus tolerans TaxID=90970 RepID=UPI001F24F870|nr:YitT family protein [Alicyclobacillus tolerans]MCF8566197.1 YitT family protein [Alicyclobacillus tolerans]
MKNFKVPPHLEPKALSRPTNHGWVSYGFRILVVLLGDFIGAVALNNFLVPAHILAGGITGIAQLLHHIWVVLPIGTLYFVFNIPLFLVGYRFLGKRFVLLTGVGIVGFSAFTDLIHIRFIPVHDPLLISLYGGVLSGISSGIVIRVGGSMGGTDILGLVFNRLFNKNFAAMSFAINVAIVLVSMTVFGVAAGMYTLVSMFAASRVVNALMHYQQRKTALIVSTHCNEISQLIGERLGRGSTLLNASGTYTNSSVGVLMCALTHLEVTELKLLATSIDKNVFITVLDTTEVVGRFRHLSV